MKKADLEAPEVDVIELINTGGKIIDATLPWITNLINELVDLGKSDNIKTARGKRIHIERLEAVDKLHEQRFEIMTEMMVNTNEYLKHCIKTGALPEFPDFTF